MDETLLLCMKIGIVIGAVMTAAAYLVLLERWMAAWVQMRRGPNRVGIPLTDIRLAGLGQPIADGLKFIFKEEYTPAHVDRRLFTLAPIVVMVSALAVYAAIPLGDRLPAVGFSESQPLTVAPELDVGLLYIFGLSSIAVYGALLGGWSSNNKYSLLGGLRSSAQLVAYELPLGLGILAVVLGAGSLRLDRVIEAQAADGVWFAFWQPLGMLVFVVASFAEAARLPFDLPEAEQELVGGYHTEYSGMRLMLLLTAEFIHMITAALLITILYLGGWHLWGLSSGDPAESWLAAFARVAILLVKTFIVILFFMLVRWTWPRFRYDQLMALAWKGMLPLGMVHLVVVAVLTEYGQEWPWGVWVLAGWSVALSAWALAAWAGSPRS